MSKILTPINTVSARIITSILQSSSGITDILLSDQITQTVIGFVIGTSFSQIVSSVSDGLVKPVLSRFGSKPLPFEVSGIFSNLVLFLVLVPTIYYLLIVPLNQIKLRVNQQRTPVKENQ
jgi:large-conductance mechanosensitive channel